MEKLFAQGSLFFPLGKIIKIETNNNLLTNRYFNEAYQVPGQLSLSYRIGSWIVEMAYYFSSLSNVKEGFPLFNLSYLIFKAFMTYLKCLLLFYLFIIIGCDQQEKL